MCTTFSARPITKRPLCCSDIVVCVEGITFRFFAACLPRPFPWPWLLALFSALFDFFFFFSPLSICSWDCCFSFFSSSSYCVVVVVVVVVATVDFGRVSFFSFAAISPIVGGGGIFFLKKHLFSFEDCFSLVRGGFFASAPSSRCSMEFNIVTSLFFFFFSSSFWRQLKPPPPSSSAFSASKLASWEVPLNSSTSACQSRRAACTNSRVLEKSAHFCQRTRLSRRRRRFEKMTNARAWARRRVKERKRTREEEKM